MDRNEGSWTKWGTHILEEIKRFDKSIEDLGEKVDSKFESTNMKIEKKLTSLDNKIANYKSDSFEQLSKMKVEVAMLKVKSGVLGFIAGSIPSLIDLIKELVK